MTDLLMHSFGYSVLVLTSSHPGKMRVTMQRTVLWELKPPQEAQMNAALINEGHRRQYQSLYC